MKRIVVYHTPDADDAFMFYPLFQKLINVNFEYEERIEDIETLNNKILNEELDVSAISVAVYPEIEDKYFILGAGGSFGEGYGPIIVSRKNVDMDRAKDLSIAVPGMFTTSYLLYKMAAPVSREITMRFDKIIDAVINGETDLGLLIHEGQLVYSRYGLTQVMNLYDWWKKEAGKLPLPLGVNVVNRRLGLEGAMKIKSDFQKSIEYSLSHQDDAIIFASKFGRGTDLETLKKFALQYVNARTYEMGDDGRRAIEILLRLAREKNIIGHDAKIEIL